MIISFADRNTREFWLTARSDRLAPDVQARAFRKLQLLDAAASLEFLRALPGNRLEKLKGDRKNQYSLRVNQQWRICFIWQDGEVYEVEFVDYH